MAWLVVGFTASVAGAALLGRAPDCPRRRRGARRDRRPRHAERGVDPVRRPRRTRRRRLARRCRDVVDPDGRLPDGSSAPLAPAPAAGCRPPRRRLGRGVRRRRPGAGDDGRDRAAVGRARRRVDNRRVGDRRPRSPGGGVVAGAHGHRRSTPGVAGVRRPRRVARRRPGSRHGRAFCVRRQRRGRSRVAAGDGAAARRGCGRGVAPRPRVAVRRPLVPDARVGGAGERDRRRLHGRRRRARQPPRRQRAHMAARRGDGRHRARPRAGAPPRAVARRPTRVRRPRRSPRRRAADRRPTRRRRRRRRAGMDSSPDAPATSCAWTPSPSTCAWWTAGSPGATVGPPTAPPPRRPAHPPRGGRRPARARVGGGPVAARPRRAHLDADHGPAQPRRWLGPPHR